MRSYQDAVESSGAFAMLTDNDSRVTLLDARSITKSAAELIVQASDAPLSIGFAGWLDPGKAFDKAPKAYGRINLFRSENLAAGFATTCPDETPPAGEFGMGSSALMRVAGGKATGSRAAQIAGNIC